MTNETTATNKKEKNKNQKPERIVFRHKTKHYPHTKGICNFTWIPVGIKNLKKFDNLIKHDLLHYSRIAPLSAELTSFA